jgi:hypothetical protein
MCLIGHECSFPSDGQNNTDAGSGSASGYPDVIGLTFISNYEAWGDPSLKQEWNGFEVQVRQLMPRPLEWTQNAGTVRNNLFVGDISRIAQMLQDRSRSR